MRSKSRGRLPGDRTKKLPPSNKTKPNKPAPINFNNTRSSPNNYNNNNHPQQPHHTGGITRKIGGNNMYNSYVDKQLPPSRLRARTDAQQSPPSGAAKPQKQMHELPSIGFGSGGKDNNTIDSRPSLKPHKAGSNKGPRKRASKPQKKPLPPNSRTSTKNAILPTTQIEEKENETELVIAPIMPDDQNILSNHNHNQSPRSLVS